RLFPTADWPATLCSGSLPLFRQRDGTYFGAALPGPGAVLVRRSDGRYVPARASQKAFFKLRRMPSEDYGGSADDLWVAGWRNVAPLPPPVRPFHAGAVLNPPQPTQES